MSYNFSNPYDMPKFFEEFKRQIRFDSDKRPTRTTMGTPGTTKSLTTYDVGSILQGSAARRSSGLTGNAFAQLAASELNELIRNTDEGVDYAKNLKEFPPADIMNKSFFGTSTGAAATGPSGSTSTTGSTTGGGNATTDSYNSDPSLKQYFKNSRDGIHVDGSTFVIVDIVGTVNGVAFNTVGVRQSVASSWAAMAIAAAQAGVGLSGNGYRPYTEQQRLREQHCCTDPNSSHCGCGPDTAPPGSSRHEKALAVDLTNSSSTGTAVFIWMSANAGTFGWQNYAPEPWHWSIDGG